jgi:hypothetical protein
LTAQAFDVEGAEDTDHNLALFEGNSASSLRFAAGQVAALQTRKCRKGVARRQARD